MVTVEFTFNEEHFRDCCVRYRQSGRKRWLSWILRLVGFGVCGHQGYQAVVHRQPAFIVFYVFAVIFFAFFPQIMNWIARLQHRRSPYRNEDVRMEFSEEGVDIKSPTTDVQCRWSAFTSVTEFEDGLLMFRGPLFHWIPIHVVTSDGGIGALQNLAREKIDDYTVRSSLKV